MKKLKSILSLAAIIILVGMYVVTLVFSIMGSEIADGLFMTSLYCTIIVPIWIFALQFFYKRVHPKDEVSIKKYDEVMDKLEEENKQ